MSARLPAHALDAVAQKWRALAERRRAHFLELYESGRWRRYYGEEQFLYRMREAIGLAERWAEIASRSVGDLAPAEGEPAPDTSRPAAA